MLDAIAQEGELVEEREAKSKERRRGEGLPAVKPTKARAPAAEKEPAAEELTLDMEDMDETQEATEEKRQRIYELSEQDYSIAEIAKMLNMGQEEVKFILDFRRKKGVESTLHQGL